MIKTPRSARPKQPAARRAHGRRFLKVYWPYLPVALLAAALIGFWWLAPRQTGYVWARATDISVNGLLSATNEQRARHNVPALRLDARLNSAAQAKADDMVARNYWSHVSPDGQEPWIFIQRAGYEYTKVGENLAFGFNDSAAVVAGWMSSATHRANLLHAAYQDAGFGIAHSPDFINKGPQTVVVAMYGAPARASPAPATAAPEPPAARLDIVTSIGEITEPPTTPVTLVEILTDGRLPWAFFVVGLIGGGAASLLVFRHGLRLKRWLIRGEQFILHHPLIDAGLILLIALAFVLSRSVGFVR